MSNSPFSSDSGCASLQAIGRVELDITSCWAIVQQVSRGLPDGAGRARLPASTFVAASSFQFSLRHHFRTPRPGRCTFEVVTFDPNERRRLTVSVVLRRLRLIRCADPSTQPQGAFPHRQRAGCPRVRYRAFNQHAATDPLQHSATVPIA